jgi:hypothetical protein
VPRHNHFDLKAKGVLKHNHFDLKAKGVLKHNHFIFGATVDSRSVLGRGTTPLNGYGIF